MAIREDYITVEELREIVDVIEALNKFSDTLREKAKRVSVNLFEEADGLGKTFPVIDNGGLVLGHIGTDEGGHFAFYLDDGAE